MTYIIRSFVCLFACFGLLVRVAICTRHPILTMLLRNITWGYQLCYGNYYGDYGIDNYVTTVYLFSDALKIVEIYEQQSALAGYGQVLTLYDVTTLPGDTMLAAGTYTADTVRNVFTFMPGKIYEIGGKQYYSGTTISYYELKSTDSKTKLVTDGSFTVSVENDTIYTIAFDLKTDDDKPLKGELKRAVLPAYGIK